MSDNLTAVLIVAIAVLGPCWLTFRFLARGRDTARLNAVDQAAYAQMSESLARMEARMAVLERILDAEAPAWRAPPIMEQDYGKAL